MLFKLADLNYEFDKPLTTKVLSNPNHKIVAGLLTDIESICQFLEEAKGANEQLLGQLNLRLQSLVNELKRHCCQKSIKTALNAINILNQKSTSIEAYKQTLTSMLSA